MSEYCEQLPESCPPLNASDITDEIEVFRLVSAIPPSDEDFKSQRALKPNGRFSFSECDARGISVWVDAGKAIEQKRYPKFKNSIVCRVRLHNGAGRIIQCNHSAHRTWWPYKGYEILTRCEATE
jgi:hypothetical protein